MHSRKLTFLKTASQELLELEMTNAYQCPNGCSCKKKNDCGLSKLLSGLLVLVQTTSTKQCPLIPAVFNFSSIKIGKIFKNACNHLINEAPNNQ